MIRSKTRTTVLAILALGAVTLPLSGQVFTTIAEFDSSDGAVPMGMSLIQGPDGSFYGTAEQGGKVHRACPYNSSCGTIFKVTPGGTLSTLYTFCQIEQCYDGSNPRAGLVLGTDGNLYGTTEYGGDGHCRGNGGLLVGCGTVFEITGLGDLTTLHSFDKLRKPDGWDPQGGLIQGLNGLFYGTTFAGGTHDAGTVYQINGSELTVIHNFCRSGGCPNGPRDSLVLGSDGNFYGITQFGGPQFGGTVSKVNAAGKGVVLYGFNENDDLSHGFSPISRLVLANDGNFYGTTPYGGDVSCNAPYGCGTVFRITPGGILTTLHSFELAEGLEPSGALVQGTDGKFYGTTYAGGDISCNAPAGCGGVFQIDFDGTLTVIHTFEGDDGYESSGGLLQGTDGKFYGTTALSTQSDGTIFSIDMGLDPFVSVVRPAGKIGGTTGILGQGFTGSTNVTFNGVPAHFTVRSDTLLAATIPPGATSGFVTVNTPTGTLTSNKQFVVLP